MPSPTIESFLKVQDLDRQHREIKAEILSIPKDIEVIERSIRREREALESGKGELRRLEVSRKELEGAIATSEEKVIRLKNQQLEVKKNEEYTALENEIGVLKTRIGELEDSELAVLEEIDQERERVAGLEAVFAGDEARHREGIAVLEERLTELKEEEAVSQEAFEKALSALEPKNRDLYEGLSRRIKRLPLFAAIVGHTCAGCHLRVSNDVNEEAVKGNLPTCDNCGRVVYLD